MHGALEVLDVQVIRVVDVMVQDGELDLAKEPNDVAMGDAGVLSWMSLLREARMST